MGDQRHLIKRQVVEIEVGSSEQAARVQSEISRIYRQRFLPMIERICEELSAADRLHRIDSLKIDLGQIDGSRLEEQLIEKLASSLRLQLAEQIRSLDEAAGLRSGSAKTDSQWELFELFVRQGTLPWWADARQAKLPESSLDFLLNEAPVILQNRLPKLVRDASARKRLTMSFDDRRLSRMLSLLVPELSDYPGALEKAFSALRPRQPRLALIPPSRFRGATWQTMFAIAVLPVPHLDRLNFTRHVGLRLGGLHAIPYAALVEGLLGAAAEDSLSEVESFAQDLLGEFESALHSEPAERPPNESRFPPTANRQEEQTVGQSPSLFKNESEQSGGKAERTATKPLDEFADSRVEPRGTSARKLEDARFLAGNDSRGVKSGPSASLEKPNPPPGQGLGDDRWPGEETAGGSEFWDADEIYLGNCGLVILWPFLQHFFGRLGLLEAHRFVDETARQRGVALLQSVASADAAPPEYLLPLNKLLCGMAVDSVYALESPLTGEEIAECDRLLEAAIAHASILNDMSVAGFRASFLLRPGMLEVRDGAWLLRVERETHDLVLDRFPWDFHWVRLPWMDVPLEVEW